MNLSYQSRFIGDAEQALKSFLIGSLIISSVIMLFLTENEMVFLSLIGLVLVGIFLAIDLFMIQHKLVFFYSNLVLITAGGIISLIFHAFGLTGLYFAVIVILAIVTWLHPIVIKKKSKK